MAFKHATYRVEIEDKYMYVCTYRIFKKKALSLNELNKQTRNEEQATPLNCTGFSSFFLFFRVSFHFLSLDIYISEVQSCSECKRVNEKVKIKNENMKCIRIVLLPYYAIYKYSENR